MRRPLCILAMFLAVVLLACSCELIYEAKDGSPKIERVNILVYGNDYANCTFDGSPLYIPHRRDRRLFGTVNDATQVGLAFEALARESGLESNAHYILGKNHDKKGEGFLYEIQNAIETPDKDTTMAHFREVLSQIADTSTEKDLTVVFVSCHGFYDASVGTKAEYGKAEGTYFVTSANTGDECELYSHRDFLEDVSKIKGIKLILADVCHSGGIVKPDYVGLGKDEYKGMDAAQLFFENEKIDIDASLFCLSASRYYEESFEYRTAGSDDRTHGYFTVALLEALGWNGESYTGNAKAARNGRLTFQNLVSYVTENDNEGSQTPMSSGGGNDVVLFSF